jgi:hypothetical protein
MAIIASSKRREFLQIRIYSDTVKSLSNIKLSKDLNPF